MPPSAVQGAPNAGPVQFAPMIEDLKELVRYRELLFIMVRRELSIRYKNSVLGVFWSFLTPLLTTVVLTVVFKIFLKNGVSSYSAYYLAAFLPFMFVQASVMDASQSVISALPVVKKIYFPRELLPLANVISNFIHFLLGFAVFFLYLLYVFIRHRDSFPLQWTAVYLPFLMLISFMLATGLAFLASALNTFYEDVKYIISVVMYLMFFSCPIMYFVENVANSTINKAPYYWVYKLYCVNPISALCVAYRKTLLAPVKIKYGDNAYYAPIPMDWNYVWSTLAISIVVLIYGYRVFNKLKWTFVERP